MITSPENEFDNALNHYIQSGSMFRNCHNFLLSQEYERLSARAKSLAISYSQYFSINSQSLKDHWDALYPKVRDGEVLFVNYSHLETAYKQVENFGEIDYSRALDVEYWANLIKPFWLKFKRIYPEGHILGHPMDNFRFWSEGGTYNRENTYVKGGEVIQLHSFQSINDVKNFGKRYDIFDRETPSWGYIGSWLESFSALEKFKELLNS